MADVERETDEEKIARIFTPINPFEATKTVERKARAARKAAAADVSDEPENPLKQMYADALSGAVDTQPKPFVLQPDDEAKIKAETGSSKPE
jgi:hypothetical protein